MAEGHGKNAALRIAVDVLMAVCLVAVVSTALVQEAPHEYLGITLVALMIAHLALSRRWLAQVFRGRYDAVRVLQVASVAGFGALSFAQLGMGDYLLGRVQFASADYDAPIALSFARFASVAALIAGTFHYMALALGRRRRQRGRASRVQ